jgi:non-homologous end joining protein Ku
MASIWTGALSFGLVNIPVTLASAVRAAERTSFRMLHK